jgi:hypothetical protein
MQAFDVNANGYMLNEFTHVQNATHVLVARKFPTQVCGFNSSHRDKHEHGPFPGVIMVLHVMFRGGDSERKKTRRYGALEGVWIHMSWEWGVDAFPAHVRMALAHPNEPVALTFSRPPAGSTVADSTRPSDGEVGHELRGGGAHPLSFQQTRPHPTVQALAPAPVSMSLKYARQRGFPHVDHRRFEYMCEVEDGVVEWSTGGQILNLNMLCGNWMEAGAEFVGWFGTPSDAAPSSPSTPPATTAATVPVVLPYNGIGDIKPVAMTRDFVRTHVPPDILELCVREWVYGSRHDVEYSGSRKNVDSCVKNCVAEWLAAGPHADPTAAALVRQWPPLMVFSTLPTTLQVMGAQDAVNHSMTCKGLTPEQLGELGRSGIMPRGIRQPYVLAQPVYAGGHHGHCVLLRGCVGEVVEEFDPCVPARGFTRFAHRQWSTLYAAYNPCKVVKPDRADLSTLAAHVHELLVHMDDHLSQPWGPRSTNVTPLPADIAVLTTPRNVASTVVAACLEGVSNPGWLELQRGRAENLLSFVTKNQVDMRGGEPQAWIIVGKKKENGAAKVYGLEVGNKQTPRFHCPATNRVLHQVEETSFGIVHVLQVVWLTAHPMGRRTAGSASSLRDFYTSLPATCPTAHVDGTNVCPQSAGASGSVGREANVMTKRRIEYVMDASEQERWALSFCFQPQPINT